MSAHAEISESELESQELPQARWGGRLRDLRIAKHMTLEDIESELHLEIKLLEAIEGEDVANLPEAPFVKGYLRNYARMLDVEHESIIDAYNEVCGDDPSNIVSINKIRESNSQDDLPRYVTIGLIAVLVISLGTWWASKILSSDDKEQPAASVSQSSTTEDTASEPTINTTIIVDSGVASSQSESNLASISLKFDEDSWVEIIDANDKPLFTRTGKKGQTLTAEGVPPLSVLLGNSAGVIIEYKGQLFDHRGYDKGDGIARFTLE